MNSTCPTCGTTYRVDPAKVPEGGIRARCLKCESVFRVVDPAKTPPPPVEAAAERVQAVSAPATQPPAPPPAPQAVSASAATTPSVFGVADPHSKARRLARALISDIAVYHPERREQSLSNGSLRQEFREEIHKSWEEYVGQVGDSLARGTPYFREALNEILAGGQQLF